MNDFLLKVLDQLTVVTRRGKENICWCPYHPDGQGKPPHQPNLHVSERGFICHACGEKGSLKKLAQYLGIEVEMDKQPIAIYDYKDEKGILLFQILRNPGKVFKARRPDGLGGWIWETKGIKRVPYRLPELLNSDSETIYIAEGERDVENLRKIGLIATCNPFGAKKWRSEYNSYFKGKKVVILPDQDEEGKKHAEMVASSLLPFAQEVKILDLPGLEEKQDVTDWLVQGNTKEDLLRLVEKGVKCTNPYTTPCTQTTEIQIKLRPWSVVVSESVEEREWLIKKLLARTGLGLLVGWAKEGKSTFALHFCRAVAQGKPFLGRETQKAPAIYINYEMPEDYRAELMAASDIPDNAYWLDRPEHILSIETVAKIIDEANSANGLLVIDSFRGAFQCKGEAENQVGGAGLILRNLQRLATEKGWLILLIHHKNRSGKLSGTGDFFAAADVIMLWKRPNPLEPGLLEIEGRMAPIEPMAVRLTLESAEYLGEAKEILRAEDMKRVLEALTDEPVQASELAEQLDMPSGSVRAYLSKLYQEGKIKRSGSGKRGDPYLYCVESVETVFKESVHNTQTEMSHQEMVEKVLETFPGAEIVDNSELPF